MSHYTTLPAAIDRINRAISNLDSDINEWTLAKSSIFSKAGNRKSNSKELDLRNEFDAFIERSIKVRQNLLIFKSLFDNISEN